MNKKGIIFTVIAIVFIVILVFFVVMRAQYRKTDQMEKVSYRVETMNNFIENLDKDLERALYISGFRTVEAMTDYIQDNATYFSDVEAVFERCQKEGMINSLEPDQMVASSMDDWIANFKLKAESVNINITFLNYDLDVYQENPWYITMKLDIEYTINDTKNKVSWYRNPIIISKLKVEGFFDPVYIKETQGKYKINITRDSNTVYNTDALLCNHITNHLYTEHDDAPSFLMRFGGNFSASPYGIESIVHLADMQDSGATIDSSKSDIDHIYFSPNNPIPTSRPLYCAAWFKRDNAHLLKYP